MTKPSIEARFWAIAAKLDDEDLDAVLEFAQERLRALKDTANQQGRNG